MLKIHHEVFDRQVNDTDEVIVAYTVSTATDGQPPKVEIVSTRHGVTNMPTTLSEREQEHITGALTREHRDAA